MIAYYKDGIYVSANVSVYQGRAAAKRLENCQPNNMSNNDDNYGIKTQMVTIDVVLEHNEGSILLTNSKIPESTNPKSASTSLQPYTQP